MRFKTINMHKWTKSPTAARKIGFVLFDQFSNLCLANCLEPLRAANTFSGCVVYQWELLTLSGAAVVSSSGMPVLPKAALLDAGGWDYLFVLASYDYQNHNNAKVWRALRQAALNATIVVGLDTAPWLMASAGLLEGRRATVHWDVIDSFSETFLSLNIEQSSVVYDANRITCAGAMSALDLTLELIADHLGQAMRLDIAHLFMQTGAPDSVQKTGAQPTSRLIRDALKLMRDTIETPLSLPQLARLLSCPPKTLERRFKDNLQAPPGTVYRHLRLSKAAQLIDTTTLSVAEISLRCGYDNPSAFTRAFKARYGAAPTISHNRRPGKAQRYPLSVLPKP